ncbi:arylsulfatase [Haloferula chungangensis]|uniref:Arylsulfatase n=1 Tax=Haloferula chungangensis TaxID=1048331 RepID=A0ABW2L8E0_9BACT
MLALLVLPALLAAPLLHAAQPNIVILYADDMGYGDLRANNPSSKIPTPNLDRLAAEGMRFTDGHSSSGICTPSRYALLTGRHHWRDFHGIVNAMGGPVFKPGQLTLPAMLQKNGYTTACIGKWHLGWDWDAIKRPDAQTSSTQQWGKKTPVWGHEDFDWSKPIPGGPLDRGFDHYFGDSVINFPPYCWIEDNRVTQVPDTTLLPGEITATTKEGNWEVRPGPARSDWDFYQALPTLADKGVAWIEARKDSAQPFFLYFPFPSPHAPIIPTDEFDGKSQAGPYGDFVYQTDHICGRILEALEKAGKADNTIVIFTADNGPEQYAYARDEKYDHWSSAPLRGSKRDIFEGGHHVPFIIKWPGLIKPGSASSALISQTDIMATLASELNYDLPSNSAADSFDFLPYLKGDTASGPRTTMVHNTYKNAYALRQGDWVLIDAKSGAQKKTPKAWLEKHNTPAEDQPVGLYNLKEDLGQRHNLAAKHPEKVAQLQARLKEIRASDHTAPRLD